jgi:hypothetical protein
LGFRQVSHESWFSRILGSIKSVAFGFLLAAGSLPLMWCNEGRAVRTARSLGEGRGAVVAIAADTVDPAKEGRLVHLSGRADTGDQVRDPELGVSANAIQLLRTTEMYQWKEYEKSETRHKLGGGTETVRTYSHSEVWSKDEIDSDSFHGTASYRNPGPLPFASTTFFAENVTLGAFRLSRGLVEQMSESEPLPLKPETAAAPPAATQLRLAGEGFYRGKDPQKPQIGDVRVLYRMVRPQTVSVIARQSGASFEPYQTRAGNALLMLEAGEQSADAMFHSAEVANTVLTWILRAVGFLLLFAGVMLVFRPISVLGSVVPLFGSLLGAGLFLFSLGIAITVSLATMAVAWVFYRPLLGFSLFAAMVAGLVLLHRHSARRRAARTR